MALNKKTGAVIWKSAVPGGDNAAYASAIVVEGGGRKQYVQSLTKGFVGVDAKTGQFLWRYKEVAKGPAQYFTPITRGEYVYGGALRRGGMVRLKLGPGGVAAEQVLLTPRSPNGIGGAVLVGETLSARKPGLRWSRLISRPVSEWQGKSIGWSSIAYADGRYIPSWDQWKVRSSRRTLKHIARREDSLRTPSQRRNRLVRSPRERLPIGDCEWETLQRDLGTLWAYASGGAVEHSADSKDSGETR